MAFKKNLSVFLGFKVIAIIPGLSEIDKRVAAAILDHWNQKTGRCDPSVGRIALLLGVSVRAVIRATMKCERIGLLWKVRHGGNFLCNQYEFNWAMIEDFEANWKERKRSGGRAVLTPTQGQMCPQPPANSVHQTFPKNLSKETFPLEEQTRRPSTLKSRRLSNDRPRGNLVAVRARDAAWNSAERRWNVDVLHHFGRDPGVYSRIIAITGKQSEAATEAEYLSRGAGLIEICNTLSLKLPEPES